MQVCSSVTNNPQLPKTNDNKNQLHRPHHQELRHTKSALLLFQVRSGAII
nr:MAG TPA: hypothetical protein [Caudoviricetes sp.]